MVAEGGVGRIERLERFFGEWHAVRARTTLASRLARFCAAAHPFYAALATRPVAQRVDATTLADVIPRLSQAIIRSRSSGRNLNPWAVAGLGRREVRNAAVLASLWSNSRCGDVGTCFLIEFLARVTGTGASLPHAAELAEGYVVRTEHCPGADGADRVDLVVETSHHLVGIEVKIDAAEGPAQLARYLTAIDRNAWRLDKTPAVVLLAPFPPSRPGVLAADWAGVRAAAEASLPPRTSEYAFTHHLISAFAAHIAHF